MNVEPRVKQAIVNHKKGYNCAQSVACAYCDCVGVDEETIFKMTEGFGAGIGGMEQVCGALSGAVALAGLVNSSGCSKPTSKGGTYRISKELLRKFQEKNGSVICKELKGLEHKKVLRSCEGCIQDAAQLVEEIVLAGK